MKRVLLFFILAFAVTLFSAQFEITKDVTELTGDITAAKYGYKDVNGDWCAILKVYTDIKVIQFSGIGYEKHDYRDGIYIVYMQPDSRNITFIKDGYTTNPHTFPFKLKSNQVYSIEVKGIGEEKKIEDIAITVITEPKGSSVYIDGVNKGSSEQINAGVGRHELKLEKTGYETKNEIIEVTPGKTLFKYNLEKVIEAVVEIYSEPSGAKVYIDDKQYGITPVSDFFPPGNYSIRLTYDNYEDVNENIQIKSPETKKTYKLTDIRAELTINTHEKAKVFINGEQVAKYKNIKLAPQVATVKVEMNKAKTIEERVMLGKKEVKTIEMYPQIATGTVQVAVIPTDALIELSEDGGEKYTNTGSKVFSDVPVGNYKLKVSKNGFMDYTDKITVEEGKTARVSGIKLNQYRNKFSGSAEELKQGRYFRFASENAKTEITGIEPIRYDNLEKIRFYYHFIYDTNGNLTKVCFYENGKLSDNSYFRAAQVKIEYGSDYENHIYLNTKDEPAPNSQGVYKEVYKLNEKGHQVNRSNYNRYDQLSKDSTQVEQYRFETDENGQKIKSYRLNKDGDIILGKDGVAIKRNKFDENGNWIETKLYDTDEKLVEDTNGISIYRYKYDENQNIIENKYLDSSENLKDGMDGIAVKRYKFDENRNRIEVRLYDKNEKLKADKYGIAIYKYKFDGNGNIIENQFFNTNEELIEGTAIYRLETDENGNEKWIPYDKNVKARKIVH